MLMVFGFLFQQSNVDNRQKKCKEKVLHEQQFVSGYSGNPRPTSFRVLTISVLLFSMVMFQFYSSFIVSSLLTEAPKYIKTVKQLLNTPFEFGIDDVPYVIEYFRSAKEESTVELYNKNLMNPDKIMMSLQTGLHMVKQGDESI